MTVSWESFHIFYHDQNKYDELLVLIYTGLKKVYKHKLPSFFFIRYWEGGPHIRLRIENMNKDQKETFLQLMTEVLKSLDNTLQLDKKKYYNQYENLIKYTEDLPWFENKTIYEVPYKPEISRYNGKKMMQLSELQFCFSSRYTLEFLNTKNPNYEQKYNYGLFILFQLLRSMGLSLQQEIDFLRSYCIATLSTYKPDDVKRYLILFEKKLKTTNLLAFVQKYRNTQEDLIFKQYSEWTKQIRSAVGMEEFDYNNIQIKTLDPMDKQELAIGQLYWSWIHMFFNRLGLSPLIEAEFSFLLSHTLNQYKDVKI